MDFVRLFTLTFTLGLLTISSIGQTSYYSVEFFIEDEKAQDQYYKVEQNKGSVKIQERGIFLSNPDIYAFAESQMDSLGYQSVEIAFDNGSINSKVLVSRAKNNNRKYYSFFNGELVDSLAIKDSTVVLFDGPNPTFDLLNSKFLNKNNIKQSITLVLINWINGTLSTEQAHYTLGKSEVAIHKKRSDRISFLFFEKDEFMPYRCYQNKESYRFRKVDELEKQLKK